MSFVFPMEEMFDAFGEEAALHTNLGIVPFETIANFNLEFQTDNGFETATGYVGQFDVDADIYDLMTLQSRFDYKGKTFQVVQKKPVDAGVYQVVAEA